jgi:hypothetical protein
LPWSFASGGRRSAAQNEENPPPLRSGCRLVDGAHNKGDWVKGGAKVDAARLRS